jgi:hypothetical protein
MLREIVGRTSDLASIALAHAVLRPVFARIRADGDRLARVRHEPFAARGDEFVRSVGPLEKAAFVAKMLGTDAGWGDRSPAHEADDAGDAGGEELLFAGDLLSPGVVAGELSAALKARIARASSFVVNLEATVGDRANEIASFLTARGLGQLWAYARNPEQADWVSRFDPESLRALIAWRSRVVVSVANNHTLDDGERGYERTVDAARALGLGVVGDARSDDGGVVVEVGERRIGLFAMAYGTNRPASTGDVHLRFDEVPYRVSRDRAAAIVEALRARGASHVVAILHWGYEHEREPADEQRACADALFAAGVSAIVGHHPHVVQRSESRAGRWVSYSLGDFVGGDRTIWSRIGALVALRFRDGGEVVGEMVPVVQSPYWRRQRTMLLDEAPRLERAVFARYFAGRL